VATTGQEPIIDVLEQIWRSTLAATDGLTEQDWHTPSDLPGWTVKDCLSHVATVEAGFLGEPTEQVAVSHLAHVRSPFQEAMEVGVEAWRPLPGAEVRARFADIWPRRVAQLRSMTPAELDAPSASPLGEVPYRQFMVVRAFDCWMHEQDIRRALDRPGNLEGPGVGPTLDRFRAALGVVVGKRAAAPDGTCLVLRTTGPTEVAFGVAVEGRARVVDVADLPGAPDAVVTLPFEALVALGGGRWDRVRAEAAGGVSYEGDADLGRRVLDNLAFTP
jgi:uncharacterized protein (TIGR03083 family)